MTFVRHRFFIKKRDYYSAGKYSWGKTLRKLRKKFRKRTLREVRHTVRGRQKK